MHVTDLSGLSTCVSLGDAVTPVALVVAATVSYYDYY